MTDMKTRKQKVNILVILNEMISKFPRLFLHNILYIFWQNLNDFGLAVIFLLIELLFQLIQLLQIKKIVCNCFSLFPFIFVNHKC